METTTGRCFVTHLEAAIDGTELPADQLQTLHKGRPLWVRYDLDVIKRTVSPADILTRPASLWRYRELLPVRDLEAIVSLGEGMSPLLRCPRLGEYLGVPRLIVKDESQLPTGSFKSRGMAMAVSMAAHFGVTRVALPTAGNAGGAAAAYAARAGMECFVFMPADTPAINQFECQLAGAHAYRVNGLINDCGRLVGEGRDVMKWFDLSTLKEPYRIEGKKTMGLELAEQLSWQLPDVILYPTGGGTGLIGMWKAFQELKELGWLQDDRLPRMVAVQSDGCDPIVNAFDAGERFAEPISGAETMARGIRVPSAVGDFMILDAIRESGGRACRVPEQSIPTWLSKATQLEGISFCPETAACIAAAESLSAEGWIVESDRVVIFNTGAGQKYLESIACELPDIDCQQAVDWQAFAAGLAE
jgi:threonine synthase